MRAANVGLWCPWNLGQCLFSLLLQPTPVSRAELVPEICASSATGAAPVSQPLLHWTLGF